MRILLLLIIMVTLSGIASPNAYAIGNMGGGNTAMSRNIGGGGGAHH